MKIVAPVIFGCEEAMNFDRVLVVVRQKYMGLVRDCFRTVGLDDQRGIIYRDPVDLLNGVDLCLFAKSRERILLLIGVPKMHGDMPNQVGTILANVRSKLEGVYLRSIVLFDEDSGSGYLEELGGSSVSLNSFFTDFAIVGSVAKVDRTLGDRLRSDLECLAGGSNGEICVVCTFTQDFPGYANLFQQVTVTG